MLANNRNTQESNGRSITRPKHNRDAIRFWSIDTEHQRSLIRYHNEVYHEIDSSRAISLPVEADGVVA